MKLHSLCNVELSSLVFGRVKGSLLRGYFLFQKQASHGRFHIKPSVERFAPFEISENFRCLANIGKRIILF